jgi:iron-sulfur cluster assembly protein
MSITLTKDAAHHVRDLLKQRGHGIGLRLATRYAGCNGYAYTLSYVDSEHPTDRVFLSNGVNVFINKEEAHFLDGTEIDYTKCDELNMEFEFHNPNVKDVCGCGKSFDI